MISATKIPAWIWKTSKGLRTQAVLNAIVEVLLVGLDFTFIWATKRAVDIATGRLAGSLFWTCAVLIAIMVCKVFISFVRRWIAAILGVRSQNQMQLRLFDRLMRSIWSGKETHHSGDVLNRLEKDVGDVTSIITETIPAAFGVIVRFLGAFIFFFQMDSTLACTVICIAPVLILLSRFYVRRMRVLTRDIRDTESEVQSLLTESVQHRVVLKSLEQGPTMVDRLDNIQTGLRSQVRHRTVFSSVSATLLNIGFGAGYLTTFIWGVHSLQAGSISYGTMIAFIQLIGQIQGPFRDMTRFVPMFISCITASERLMELEAIPLEQEGDRILFSNGAGIRFCNVTYAYEQDKRHVLKNLTFDFPIGSTTAILGETGAGKTTMIRLILALLQPTQGDVEIYDETRCVPASPMTRCNLVYVPQGNTLFSGTIRENLLLGNPQATEEQMKEVLETACAHFVMELPKGLDSRCGELGAGLSEGQSQRIAIARALLRHGNILLLDEATSALDAETEEQLLQRLNSRTKSRQTVICITHRPAVVEYCSQVLNLKRLTV